MGAVVLLDDEGKKQNIAADDVEEILPAEVSVMPTGLVDQLTLAEIRDLVKYLHSRPEKVAQAPETAAQQ